MIDTPFSLETLAGIPCFVNLNLKRGRLLTSLATATVCFPVIHNSISELTDERVASLCEMATKKPFLPLSVIYRSMFACATYWRIQFDRGFCLRPSNHRERLLRPLLSRPQLNRDFRRYRLLLIVTSPYTSYEVVVQFLWRSLGQTLMSL